MMNRIRRSLALIVSAVLLSACNGAEKIPEAASSSMELLYAEQFSVDYNYDGTAVISVGDGEKYLLVPEGAEVSSLEGMTVIHQPLDNIYLAASSAMDLFCSLDALDSITATATAPKDWSIPEVKTAVENEDILYAGKYSSPDYEVILSEDCEIAIESTMIYHKPEVKEQLEALGIPVFVERSSYEAHPLGRLEWIKLYGLLLGKEEEAQAFFDEKCSLVQRLSVEDTGLTAVFFYIASNGCVNVRKPGDYIGEMIRMAGGRYVFGAEDMNVDENALSSVNMQFEAFYAGAVNADVLIYNSTVDGGVSSLEELISKNELMRDFKAVQNGNVWCTEQNMFQKTSCTAEMTADLNRIFTGTDCDKLEYLYKLS